MNRHSLIFYISLFFVFLMLVINSLFYFQYRYEQNHVVENALEVLHESQKILHLSREERLPFEDAQQRLFDILNIKMLGHTEVNDFKKGLVLKRLPDVTLYDYEEKIYIHFQDNRRGIEHIFSYEDSKLYSKRIFLFAFIIDISVLLFFIYVIRRIWPLHELKRVIKNFSQGNLDVHINLDGKDEIAEVANEFNHAITTIKHLQGSRNLFLRNIMHELKTPIAKGKLITDLLADEKNAQRLAKIFTRFEFLLGEFSKIERVTSNELKLHKKHFRVVDIIDNALDILMIERDAVKISIQTESEIKVDFELFSIAIKNIIDNALKYGDGIPEITVEKNMLSITSFGAELEAYIFDNVFNRKFEDSSKGLGLGLYITKNIIQKHTFTFHYYYENGINHFTITH